MQAAGCLTGPSRKQHEHCMRISQLLPSTMAGSIAASSSRPLGAAALTLLQAVAVLVAAAVVLLQVAVAWVIRQLWGDPEALRKVAAARAAQHQQQQDDTCSSSHPDSSSTTSSSSPNDEEHAGEVRMGAEPRLVFNEPERGADCLARRLVGPFVTAHGRHAVANSCLFGTDFVHLLLPGCGALSFVVADVYHRAVVVAVGEPHAPPCHWEAITRAFLAHFPGAHFYYASEAYARLLAARLGLWVNDMGCETSLQVQDWRYSPRTRTIRAAARSAREAGVRVREIADADLTPALRAALQHEVSGDWLAHKAVADRELRVFVRAVDYSRLELRDSVRLFVAEAYADAGSAPPAEADAGLGGAGAAAAPQQQQQQQQGPRKAPRPPRRHKGGASRPGSGVVADDPATSATTTATTSSSSGSGSDSEQEPDLLAVIGEPGPVASPPAAAASKHKAAGVLQQAPSSSAPAPAPRLVGFVLLDPLWQDGAPSGYVTSLVRMTGSAHGGTLKLLYEGVLSALRREPACRTLAFGLAPFCNMRDAAGLRHVHWLRWVGRFMWHRANGVYAFQNLAFSKIRYGGGLTPDGAAFRDPAARLAHAFSATRCYAPGWLVLDMLGFLQLVGIVDRPWPTLLTLCGLRG